MRVGIFDPYLDDLGGGEKYMMTIASCLSQDHKVTVFWNNQEDLKKISDRFSLDLSKVTLKPNIFSPKVSLSNRLKETASYDAIIFLSNGSIPWVLSKKLFIHVQQPLLNVKVNAVGNLKKIRVTKFFCNSYFTKSYTDKIFGVDSKIIYPPVDHKAKKIKKENIILNVGRFRVKDIRTMKQGKDSGIGDYKKQGVMVDVFKDMVKKGLIGWKFVIAISVNKAEMETFEKFKNTVKGFPIEFLVNETNDNLWDTYSKAKIYWHASGFGENLLESPEYAEHFGISTVEAMSAGAVPVVINAGGQTEIVEDNITGFLWDDLNQLQVKTLKLTQDEELLNNLSKQAVKSSRRFTKEKFNQEISNLLS